MISRGGQQIAFSFFKASLLSVFFIWMNGCRVQAGNPQADKPKTPGTVTVALADAPVDDLSNLFITVKGIAFAPAGLGRCFNQPQSPCADSSFRAFEFERAAEVDLLSLSNGRTEVLPFSQDLPAGTYEGLRLFLAEGVAVRGVLKSDGSSVEVDFPMSPFGRREFTIAQEFDIQEGSENQLIVHVDLRRSVKKNDRGRFLLLPVVTVVPERFAARMFGSVADPNVTRVCAYNEAGKRRPETLVRPVITPSGNRPSSPQPPRPSSPQPPRPSSPQPPSVIPGVTSPQPVRLLQPPVVAPLPTFGGQPDTTNSCDNAEAVADLTDANRSYDLRHLPPVRFLLRAFKKDGSFSDTYVNEALMPRESRELNLE